MTRMASATCRTANSPLAIIISCLASSFCSSSDRDSLALGFSCGVTVVGVLATAVAFIFPNSSTGPWADQGAEKEILANHLGSPLHGPVEVSALLGRSQPCPSFTRRREITQPNF